jgi:hypothetical protein
VLLVGLGIKLFRERSGQIEDEELGILARGERHGRFI